MKVARWTFFARPQQIKSKGDIVPLARCLVWPCRPTTFFGPKRIPTPNRRAPSSTISQSFDGGFRHLASGGPTTHYQAHTLPAILPKSRLEGHVNVPLAKKKMSLFQSVNAPEGFFHHSFPNSPKALPQLFTRLQIQVRS